jgi:hypothetical protein
MYHTGEMRNAYTILAGNPEGNYHLGGQSVDGRILLKKQCVKEVTGINWLRMWSNGKPLWLGNEHLGPIKAGNF